MNTSSVDRMQIEFNPEDITSPKRARYGDPKVVADWYGYYAGYSGLFVHDVLRTFNANERSIVLDPWNGSGTTTAIAGLLGCEAVGVDLNPAMAIIAKARSARSLSADDIIAELDSTLKQIRRAQPTSLPWFSNEGNEHLGLCLNAIAQTGLDSISHLSGQQCVALTALFGTVRNTLAPLQGTNRTWWKQDCSAQIELQLDTLVAGLYANIRRFSTGIDEDFVPPGVEPRCPNVTVGNAQALPVPNETVDMVITSPPYLTRLDYVTAMLPELLLLQLRESDLQELRQQMTGSAMGGFAPICDRRWGEEANGVVNHALDAACARNRNDGLYYAGTFGRYFDALFRSLAEIDRVTKSGAAIAIVVQGSRHRGRLVDLPLIVFQMASKLRWNQSRVVAWPTRDLGRINPYSRKYAAHAVQETALLFTKP